MSRTVSFRASEELDEFLQQEAKRRMTSKSTVANMLVAERVRQLQKEQSGEDEIANFPEPDDSGSPTENGEPPELERYRDKWHTPDSQEGYKYAVRTEAGRLKYYKTADGAAERLRKEYE